MKNILITGATGYIGSKLVKKFISENKIVHVIVRENSKNDLLFPVLDYINVHTYDGFYSSIDRIFQNNKIDIVYHLATVSSYDHSPKLIDEMIEANIRFGSLLLEAMSVHKCLYFVNTGTYWENNNEPICYYAALKSAFQNIINYYCFNRSISAITILLNDVYGEDDPRQKIFTHLRQAIKDNKSFDTTLGEQEVIFLYIDDVLNAYIVLQKHFEQEKHLKYSLDVGQAISIRELIEKTLRVSGKALHVNWGAIPYKKNQIMKIKSFPSLPDWSPNIPLDDGIKKVLNYAKK